MSTLIDINTKKLMLTKRQRELDALFAEQEARKNVRQLRRLRAQGGLEVPGFGESDIYGKLEEPAFGMQPWEGMTSPQLGMPSQALNVIDAPRTPEDAFNFKDNVQVYGKELLGKLPGMFGTAATLAGPIANLAQGIFGKAEHLKPQDYYNPRRNEIASLMRNRRVNINPQLESILRGERSALYNLKGNAGSRGEFMSNATGITNTGLRNRAAAYMGKQNMDLGYQGEEAQALMSLGAGEQQAKWNTDQWNQQTLANKRKLWRAGLSQLGQYSQIKEQEANQLLQDQNRMKALEDMMGTIAPFMKMFQNFKYSNT